LKKKLFQFTEGLASLLELVVAVGLTSLAGITAFIGQFVLTGIFLLIAFGVFLRFKRRKINKSKI
jgi:uncharacterized membrane protein (DUF485 family)